MNGEKTVNSKKEQRGKKKTACNGEETVSRGTFIIFKVTEIK